MRAKRTRGEIVMEKANRKTHGNPFEGKCIRRRKSICNSDSGGGGEGTDRREMDWLNSPTSEEKSRDRPKRRGRFSCTFAMTEVTDSPTFYFGGGEFRNLNVVIWKLDISIGVKHQKPIPYSCTHTSSLFSHHFLFFFSFSSRPSFSKARVSPPTHSSFPHHFLKRLRLTKRGSIKCQWIFKEEEEEADGAIDTSSKLTDSLAFPTFSNSRNKESVRLWRPSHHSVSQEK